MFCVYLTLYHGNKLPPFYIGSTSIAKITAGYRGSIESIRYGLVYKQELKEHPELFSCKIIQTFDNRHDALVREDELQRKLKVVESELYMNLSYSALGIFGLSTKGKDNPFWGKKHTKETKKKIGTASKNRMTHEKACYARSHVKHPWNGRHTKEARLKMSGPRGIYGPQSKEHLQKRMESIRRTMTLKKLCKILREMNDLKASGNFIYKFL